MSPKKIQHYKYLFLILLPISLVILLVLRNYCHCRKVDKVVDPTTTMTEDEHKNNDDVETGSSNSSSSSSSSSSNERDEEERPNINYIDAINDVSFDRKRKQRNQSIDCTDDDFYIGSIIKATREIKFSPSTTIETHGKITIIF
jgi:hypothetical protein